MDINKKLKTIYLGSPLLEKEYNDRIVFSKSKIFVNSLITKKVISPEGYNKYIFYTAESLYNRVIIANMLARINFNLFNKLYVFIPNFILNIPIWYPYRKHLNILKKKNFYFILTNSINKIQKNIMILPLFIQRYESHYKLLLKKRIYKLSEKKFCAFIVSNPSNLDRLDFYKKLSKYKKIDSYGKVFKNSNFETKTKVQHLSNSNLFKEYKFVICFENSYESNYITEKLPNVMLGGAVPVYRGAPNVSQYFNTDSFINYDNYGSYDSMIKKIIELDNDDSKYLKFINHPWFTKNNTKSIQKKLSDLNFFLNNIFK
jgi:hypothetical protein